MKKMYKLIKEMLENIFCDTKCCAFAFKIKFGLELKESKNGFKNLKIYIFFYISLSNFYT